jgi:putative spermidine/putrescine transport system ATP-binding protein
VRPERIHLGTGASPAGNALAARIVDSVYQGDHLRVQLDQGAFDFVVRADRQMAEWPPGASVVASFQPADCWVIAK